MKTPITKLDVVLLVARVAVAAVVAAHGAQKMFGWWGGYGLEGTMHYFTETIGLPYVLGFAIILCETFGMVALALGVLTRLMSAGVITIMLGAIATAHLPFGFFMNWDGNLGGEGFEFHLLVIVLALFPACYGGGAISVQQWIDRAMRKKQWHDGMFFI
jgi:putative oxidoreductase